MRALSSRLRLITPIWATHINSVICRDSNRATLSVSNAKSVFVACVNARILRYPNMFSLFVFSSIAIFVFSFPFQPPTQCKDVDENHGNQKLNLTEIYPECTSDASSVFQGFRFNVSQGFSIHSLLFVLVTLCYCQLFKWWSYEVWKCTVAVPYCAMDVLVIWTGAWTMISVNRILWFVH